MKALLYKRKHTFAPWLLKWEVNGLEYVDTFRIKKKRLNMRKPWAQLSKQ